MEKDFIEKMLKLYTWNALATLGPDAVVVLNPEPQVYENNPTIEEYKSKGYKLCDANCFGIGDKKYEALTFQLKQGT